MIRSWLSHYTLLLGLAATGSLAKDELGGHHTQGLGLWAGDGLLEEVQVVIWEQVKYVTVAMEPTPRRVVLQRIPEPTASAQEARGVVQIPGPTAAPVFQKRQDQNAINALSGQIQRLSISFSSVSSASQSLSQSAQQALQSANQATNDASAAISRTQSSASSAVASAFAQASSQVSSQVSANLASVQASANSVISVAQASASVSMNNVLASAQSQVQAARAEATAVRGDANNFADQVQRNAISTTNLAIIVSTSVSGAVILTTVIAFLCLRYRRKRRENRENRENAREREAGRSTSRFSDRTSFRTEKDYERDFKDVEKPIAVRGGPPTAPPTNEFKLASVSPPKKKKTTDEPLNFGFAVSDYSDVQPKEIEIQKPARDSRKDSYKVFPSNFRFQKQSSVGSAETVRIIRINSNKNKAAEAEKMSREGGAPMPEAQASRDNQEEPPVSPRSYAVEQGARKSEIPDDVEEPRRRFRRDTAYPEPRRSSKRFTMNSIVESIRNSRRMTMGSVAIPEDREEPGWVPPSRGNSISQRYTVYENGGQSRPPAGGFSMTSVSNLVRSDSAATDKNVPIAVALDAPVPAPAITTPPAPKELQNRQPTIPKVAKQGPSFAAFPTVRSIHPPSLPPTAALPQPPPGASPPKRAATVATTSMANRPRPPRVQPRMPSEDTDEYDNRDSFDIIKPQRPGMR